MIKNSVSSDIALWLFDAFVVPAWLQLSSILSIFGRYFLNQRSAETVLV